MNLKEFKAHLKQLDRVAFVLPDQTQVPAHYHLTEVTLVNKKGLDCGNQKIDEEYVSLQLWVSIDRAHRLSTKKFEKILDEFTLAYDVEALETFVEYQGESKVVYALETNPSGFLLKPTYTDCRASTICLPSIKKKLSLASLSRTSDKTTCCL